MSLMNEVVLCSDVGSADFDGVVVVASSVNPLPWPRIKTPLRKYLDDVDNSGEAGIFVVASDLPSKRIIFSGTGPLDKDYDDVRSFADAAEKGIEKAVRTGCKSPLLLVHPSKFERAGIVAALGALKALYVPLEVRESVPERAAKVKKLGLAEGIFTPKILEYIKAMEIGRIVSRDIGGSDPERMSAIKVEEYVKNAFKDDKVKIEVVKGQGEFEKGYPCFAAVNRAASGVPRHDGRIIRLIYEPEGKVEKTVMLVGKGITYDTGGADIKAGGIMAGMSRDKCGAADVAGFLKVVSALKPKGLKVVGAMAMARNSVGSNCYVADEIITSRAGVRLRVGNTDAEGRMAMVDVLCEMKERALGEVNPQLMTIATLTGHAVLAVGPYTAVMDNGPAGEIDFARSIQKTGERFGDPFEISTIRREDFSMIKDSESEYVDVLQCNNAASSRTPRGHQFPAAFMLEASGLVKHMKSCEVPLKYSHLDVAGSSGNLPHVPTASSVVALAAHFMPCEGV